MSPEEADAQDDIPFEDMERLLIEQLRECSVETLITYLLTNDSAREDMQELFYADITRIYWEGQAEEQAEEDEEPEINDDFPMYLEYDDWKYDHLPTGDH